MTSRRQLLEWLCTGLLLVLCGCNTSNPNSTHRGDLLDDKVTTERVSAALHRKGAEFRGIQVTTKQGAVVLKGRVRTQQIKSEAEQVVRSVTRVSELNDELQVAR